MSFAYGHTYIAGFIGCLRILQTDRETFLQGPYLHTRVQPVFLAATWPTNQQLKRLEMMCWQD